MPFRKLSLTAPTSHGTKREGLISSGDVDETDDTAMSESDRRRRLDTVIPELIKRALELGVEKAVEAPDNLKELVGGMKVPREVANYVLSQVEDTKNGLFRVVAKEVREFLEKSNLGTEMEKILTSLQFEISTTIRFKPNGGATRGDDRETKLSKPEVKSDVSIRRTPRVAQRGDGWAGPQADERPSRDRRRTRE